MPKFRVSWDTFPIEAGHIDVVADDEEDANYRASRILGSDVEEYIVSDLPKEVEQINESEPVD